MDKKLSFAGGDPIMGLIDMLQTADSSRDYIHKMFADFYSGNPFIISGCIVTDNITEINVSEGYIFDGTQVVKVDEQLAVLNDFTGDYHYVINTSFDPAGTKIFKDAISRETWQRIRGIVTSVATPTLLNVKTGKRYADVLNANHNHNNLYIPLSVVATTTFILTDASIAIGSIGITAITALTQKKGSTLCKATYKFNYAASGGLTSTFLTFNVGQSILNTGEKFSAILYNVTDSTTETIIVELVGTTELKLTGTFLDTKSYELYLQTIVI